MSREVFIEEIRYLGGGGWGKHGRWFVRRWNEKHFGKGEEQVQISRSQMSWVYSRNRLTARMEQGKSWAQVKQDEVTEASRPRSCRIFLLR